jgi:hypothetical protein
LLDFIDAAADGSIVHAYRMGMFVIARPAGHQGAMNVLPAAPSVRVFVVAIGVSFAEPSSE